MANKLITPEGKRKLLKIGFLGNSDVGNFNYLALGGENSNASTNGTFQEIDGNSYERQSLILQTEGDQSITISAIFDENVANPSEGVEIKEIGIVDHQYPAGEEETFFAFAEVPPIKKTNNISLKYTIIISIE